MCIDCDCGGLREREREHDERFRVRETAERERYNYRAEREKKHKQFSINFVAACGGSGSRILRLMAHRERGGKGREKVRERNTHRGRERNKQL